MGEDDVSTPTATLWDCPTTEDYTIGVVEARGRGEDKEWVFVPRLACDFTVVKELKSAEGGGLILEVKNWCGTQLVIRQVIVKSIDCIKVDKFAEALTRGLGTQIACTLKAAELQALLQNRKQSYYLAGGKTYQLTDRFGRQADGAMVFSNCQFDKFGQPCTEVDSGWVFNPDLGTEDGITCPSIKPANPQALSELVRAMKAFYHPDNLGFALSDIGYAVATLFRDQILEMYNEFAQSSSDGPAGAGKSKGAKAAASIAGMHTRDRIIGKGSSDSALNENIKLCSSLPIVVDDFIPLDGALDEIKRAKKILNGTVTRAFDGTGRNVRKNKQGAHTNLLITTNIGIGGDSVALDQRIIMKTYLDRRVNVSQGEGDRLDRAMDNASGGLGQLLQISVDRDKIDRYAIDLKTRLPNADMRQARSLAIQTYFTEEFCQIAGVTDFDALAFAQEVLCPQADATDTAKSNMIDLLERLEQLRTAGAIGQHNVAMVSPKGVPYLAVCLNEVWPILSKYGTAPNYGMAAVKGQIEDCGGIIDAKTRQSFVKTKMEWDDFIRADAAWAANDGATHARPKRPSRTSPRACVLIPATVVEQALGVGWDDQVSPSSESEIVQIADYQAKQIDAPELTIGIPCRGIEFRF